MPMRLKMSGNTYKKSLQPNMDGHKMLLKEEQMAAIMMCRVYQPRPAPRFFAKKSSLPVV